MALTDNLCGIDAVKDALEIPDDGDDAELANQCAAATRQIHRRCNRFFTDAGSATARTFRADDCYRITVDDFSTTTGLVVKTDTSGDGTFDTTWTIGTDFQVEPLNGIYDGVPDHPYFIIRAVGSKTFPIDSKGQTRVEVTARWGWADKPDDVVEAAVIQAVHLFKARSAALGVAGYGDIGPVRIRQTLHPTAEALVARYARDPFPVA